MTNSRWIEMTVGLFIVIGIMAMVGLVFKVSNFSDYYYDKTYTISAAFDNVSGLKKRSAVSIAGVTIGRVSDIIIDSETFEAVVMMEIDSKYNQIPEDSSVAVYTAGLLGEKYLGIDAGGAPDYLQENSQINLTQSSIVLEKLISQFLFSKAEE
ncbi:MAG: outer membrane lipid asymmetry maintenance protein MlaD [Pseudomonadota bacterium]